MLQLDCISSNRSTDFVNDVTKMSKIPLAKKICSFQYSSSERNFRSFWRSFIRSCLSRTHCRLWRIKQNTMLKHNLRVTLVYSDEGSGYVSTAAPTLTAVILLYCCRKATKTHKKGAGLTVAFVTAFIFFFFFEFSLCLFSNRYF